MSSLPRLRHRRISRTPRLLLATTALSLLLPFMAAAPAAGSSALQLGSAPAAPTASVGAVARDCTIGAKLVPTCGAYLGVAANPLAGESYDQAMVNFENTIGRTVDIAHYYMRGESVLFPTASQIARAREPDHERLLLLNWRPDRTWRDIANGAVDSYLVALAGHIKTTYDTPFMLTLHAEMEAEVNPTPGSGMTAIDFRDFFRHTVTVLKANGATNVVFVVDYIGSPNWGDVPWFNDLYPGDSYVDWIGEDPFAFGKPPVWLSDFHGMVNRVQNPAGSTWHGFYKWLRVNHPDKPLMLAEWGVAEGAGYPQYKADFFNELVKQLRRFPQLRALVYWNSNNAPQVGITQVDSTPQSLQAFTAMAHSYELTEPGRVLLQRSPDLR